MAGTYGDPLKEGDVAWEEGYSGGDKAGVLWTGPESKVDEERFLAPSLDGRVWKLVVWALGEEGNEYDWNEVGTVDDDAIGGGNGEGTTLGGRDCEDIRFLVRHKCN